MTCPRCAAQVAALRAEIADLKQEVQAWREADAADPDLMRFDRWKRVMPELSFRHFAILLAMADHPGRVHSRARLMDITRGLPGSKADEVNLKGIDVSLVFIRRALRARGRDGRLPSRFAAVDGGVRTHWGLGWSVDTDVASAVVLLAEDDRRAVAA